jgi:probable rRNA maturation factor
LLFVQVVAGRVNLIIVQRRVSGFSEADLERFVSRAKRAASLRGAVDVLLTNSSELRRLNRRFRGKNQPTDVLSFPAIRSNGFAGDIAISVDIAARNARRLGHTPVEEIKILVLHAILHLAGYDHERDDGEMATEEGGLRMRLGLPSGLIERSAPVPVSGGKRRHAAKKTGSPRISALRTPR